MSIWHYLPSRQICPQGSSIKLSSTASAIAQELVRSGLSFFLPICYTQLLGLAPAPAGFVMTIALIVDAISAL
jgi:Na+/melibiose symporter-like transporter